MEILILVCVLELLSIKYSVNIQIQIENPIKLAFSLDMDRTHL